jgi:hypothetical protein
VKKIAASLVLGTLTTLATGCFHTARPAAPSVLDIPVVAVSEPEDEWLHTHCAPKKVVIVGSVDEGSRAVHETGGNLGEVVYQEGSALDVVSFACPSRPLWIPPVR